MDKLRKLELVQRSLGLRHKIKVHESMKQPDTHEDLAIMLLTRWEYEDELKAIEEILSETRQKNIAAKKVLLEKDDFQIIHPKADSTQKIDDYDSARSPGRKAKQYQKTT